MGHPIRDAIQEAQVLFDPLHRKLNDGVGNSDDNRWRLTGKKYPLFGNRKRQSEEVFQQLRHKLRKIILFWRRSTRILWISIGGDGCRYRPFTSKHQLDRGVICWRPYRTLQGFYTDYLDSEIDKLVENLKYDTGAKVSYPIFECQDYFQNGETRTMRALNEATIKRSDRTMVADLTINGVDFERFRGDGDHRFWLLQEVRLTINPWGAVLHPTIEALQIVEIASLNNRVYRTLGSSVIVPKKDKIEITPTRPGYIISVDNSTYSYRNIGKVEYQIDNHKINFCGKFQSHQFLESGQGCLYRRWREWDLNSLSMSMSRLRPFWKARGFLRALSKD